MWLFKSSFKLGVNPNVEQHQLGTPWLFCSKQQISDWPQAANPQCPLFHSTADIRRSGQVGFSF
jgi:hypothetical protein